MSPMIELTAADVAQVLNEAWAADPEAWAQMQAVSIPVNDELADHPTIPVCDCVAGPKRYALSVLGLINGFVSLTGEYVVAMYSDPDPVTGGSEFLGYGVKPASEIEIGPTETPDV